MLNSKPSDEFKKQTNLSFIWVAVNFIGITTGTLVAFFLYTLLTLQHDSSTVDVTKLLIRLSICGAAQGLIISGLQSIVLLLNKRELARWLATNAISMAVGMTMPTAYAAFFYHRGTAIAYQGIVATEPFNQYVMAGWLSSWLLAGLLGGFTLGTSPLQKVRWGLLNAAAYLYWGLAAAFGMRLLDRAIYNTSALAYSWIGSCLLIGLLLLLGAWLHSYVFRGIAYQRHRRLESIESRWQEYD